MGNQFNISNLTPDEAITFSTLVVNGTSTLTGAVTAASTFNVTGAVTAGSTLHVVGVVSTSGAYLSIGTNPADATSGLNLANNSQISWRNAANTGNIAGIQVDSSDRTLIPGVHAGSILINSGGDDVDVKIASNSNPNMLVVDADINGGTGGIGMGGAAASTALVTITTSGTTTKGLSVVGGNIDIETAGGGLFIAQGANATFGTVTLSSVGVAIIYSTKLLSTSIVFLTRQQTLGTVQGNLGIVGTISNGAARVSGGGLSTDLSVIGWLIVEPS